MVTERFSSWLWMWGEERCAVKTVIEYVRKGSGQKSFLFFMISTKHRKEKVEMEFHERPR